MAYDRFLIAPINTGLQTDVKPWIIPDDAFTELNNAYVFRGRIRKRFGSIYMMTNPLSSRLGVPIDITDAGGNTTAGLKTPAGVIPAIGQAFSIGAEIFTVQDLGIPISMLTTGASVVHTYNTTTRDVVITGATPLTSVIFYPALPVMGIWVYEFGPINNQPTFVFDTRFAYFWTGTQWSRSVGAVAPATFQPQWHGTNLNFFWASNWSAITADQTALFVTNYFATIGNIPALTDDPIWVYSKQFTPSTWIPYSYSPDATINLANQQPLTVTQTRQTAVPGDTILSFIETALIVLPFKDRLIMLNTIETTITDATPYDLANKTTTGVTPAKYNSITTTNRQYVNRVRFSANQSPFAVNSWLQPDFVYKPDLLAATEEWALAGFLDAPTEEAIVSAEYIKDRLIVYFQKSTWELVYTNNQVQPFLWQKINTELGAEGTFSIVPFDKVVLGVGNTGVHACSGSNVERIDNKIPDEVFKIKDKLEGVKRVVGIRDYYTEMVYWTYPSNEENPAELYPNRVFVYNYKNGSWAFNDDCITFFGYFEQQSDLTWATIQDTWENANYTWTSGVVQAQFRQILAGNQQGWVYIVAPDVSRNAGVMQISDITQATPASDIILTIIDHTLNTGDAIYIENAPSVPNLNGNIYIVIFVTTNTVALVLPIQTTPGGTYAGAGTAARVSNIQILSKQLNPYVSKGRNVYLAKIDFCVLRTTLGEITVSYFPSSSDLNMIDEAENSGSNMGTNILETKPYALYPFENTQTRLWHTVYFQTEGEFIEFLLSFSLQEITIPSIALAPFELEGMIWHTMATTSRLQ